MKLSTIFRKAGLRLGLVMRRRRRSRVLSGIERLEERHLLSAVIVDQGFGDNGVVALQIDAPREWRGTSVLTDQGGRVSFITGRPEATEILLLRQDGEIDGDHGSASERVVSGLLTTMSVQDIGVQPDGKMVVVGHSRDTGDQVVARFRRPWELDESFGTNGIVNLSALGRFDPLALVGQLEILSDGRIVVATTEWATSLTVLRLNSDGSLDSSFDGDGIRTGILRIISTSPIALSVEHGGKIVVAGHSVDGPYPRFVSVARLNENGSLDQTFDHDGVAEFPRVTETFFIKGLVANPDGSSLFLAGMTDQEGAVIIRINSDGSRDLGFDGDGVLEVTTGRKGDTNREVLATFNDGSKRERAWSLNRLIMQPDGALIAVTQSTEWLSIPPGNFLSSYTIHREAVELFLTRYRVGIPSIVGDLSVQNMIPEVSPLGRTVTLSTVASISRNEAIMTINIDASRNPVAFVPISPTASDVLADDADANIRLSFGKSTTGDEHTEDSIETEFENSQLGDFPDDSDSSRVLADDIDAFWELLGRQLIDGEGNDVSPELSQLLAGIDATA